MKKLLIIATVLFTITVLVSACGGSRNGAGCPTASKTKPFRA
jgi:hypothetical protein